MNNVFILVTCWKRLSINWINFKLRRYDTFFFKIWLCSHDAISVPALFLSFVISHWYAELFLIIPHFSVSNCATYWYWYNVSIERFSQRVRSRESKVKVALTQTNNIFYCNEYASFEYLSFWLRIWYVNGKWKRRTDLLGKRSKVKSTCDFLVAFYSLGIRLHLFIADTSFYVQRCMMMKEIR